MPTPEQVAIRHYRKIFESLVELYLENQGCNGLRIDPIATNDAKQQLNFTIMFKPHQEQNEIVVQDAMAALQRLGIVSGEPATPFRDGALLHIAGDVAQSEAAIKEANAKLRAALKLTLKEDAGLSPYFKIEGGASTDGKLHIPDHQRKP